MTTTPIPSPAPPTTLSNILSIINLALQGLSYFDPALGVPIGIAEALQKILMNALAAYKLQTGKPIDLTAIPQEALVP